MTLAQDLIARAERREITFGIVGLGYVGLPLAVELARAGFKVLGYDISPRVVDGLNAGKSHIKDIPSTSIAELRTAEALRSDDGCARGWRKPTRSRSACRRRCRKSKDPDV